MRARQPDQTGYAVNEGVRLYYEVHGSAPQTLLFVAPHPIVHSGIWKMQIPFLARHFRTIIYDGRGSGRSDRPASGHGLEQFVGDALAVLHEVDVPRCALVTEGSASKIVAALAARHPELLAAIVLLSPRFYGAPALTPGEWEEWKRRYIAELDASVRHLIAGHFSEPHSTKLADDFWGWAHDGDPRIIVTANQEFFVEADARPLLPQVRCPVLLIHGRWNREMPYEHSLEGQALLPDARLATIETPGAWPAGRDPVRVNLLIREFLARHLFSLSLAPAKVVA
jgi:pimeloyl-ACP methyl ester carboxylesterase